MHFCPNPDCAYRGWVGWGNLRANGHPNGGPWRQLLCVVCHHYFLETLGTLFHGKRASVDLIVHVIGCLAEGLGIRGTARVFEVDPNTVLQWLVEAADQLRAFSCHFLHNVRVTQVQLDELFALLSAIKDGAVNEAEAIERLERVPHWVWVAMDPESKLLLALDVGDRTLAMAQRVVHHVAQVLAPDCAPLFLTDGFREYLTALLTHYGQWVQPARQRAQGPAPKPRWMPLPQLLYAQVIKTVRRRRLVRVSHRVVFGTLKAVLAALAVSLVSAVVNTVFLERHNGSDRNRNRRKVRKTCCSSKDWGVHEAMTYFTMYSYNFCWPVRTLRVQVGKREYEQRTPAMAAGLADHVWTIQEWAGYPALKRLRDGQSGLQPRQT